MAVTHADLAPSLKSSDLGSKTGAFLMVLSILLGLFCFIMCIVAETTRSEVKWGATNDDDDVKGNKYQCAYNSSGKMPLLSATIAFFVLAIAMIVQHTHLLIAVNESEYLPEITWDSDSHFIKAFTLKIAFFFVTTWISFVVGEILLLIGLSVESGHLKNWGTLRPNCLVIQHGLFTTAGVFGLLTTFLGSGLYVTALRAQLHCRNRENNRPQILESSALYETPPRSPRRINIRTLSNENPMPIHNQNSLTLCQYLRAFDKYTNFV